MRPDQHKKKKNAEYKKKHGIAPDKGVKYEKNESPGGHRSDGRSAKTALGEANAGATGQETDNVDVLEEQNSRWERGIFSKRKIENNWDRYEEENFGLEEEFDTDKASPVSSVPIGADYQSLLDKATSGSSHFQFKNEKEWENANNVETNNKAGPSLMSIDCDALAHSLRNISLEQRLEIDKKYSIEDDFRGSNTSKTQLDKPSTNRSINHQVTTKMNNKKIGQNVSPINTNVGFSQADKLTDEIGKEKYPLDQELKSPEEGKTQHHLTDSENDRKKLEQSENVNVPSPTSVGEDDLELLLGFDNKEELSSTYGGNPTLASAGTNKVDVTTAKKPQATGDTKEDLEDWLDSILD